MGKVRFQMFIEEDQKNALEKIHREFNVSTAELIRNAIDFFLQKRGKKKEVAVEDNAEKKLLSIIGTCKGGPKDLADKHDAYLYGIDKR